MKLLSLLALSTFAVAPAFAQETRQMGSHEHGVGQLDIAIEGTRVAMQLHAPGADIVGFEYVAESAQDIAKVEAALLLLAKPLDLFTPSEAAQCSVTKAHAELESESSHEDHGEEAHEDHEEDDHDHKDEDHDHADEDHDDDADHTEFHAEYLLDCGDTSALNDISFGYFAAFPNALEVEVKLISDSGASAFEVERDAPMLDLSDLN